MLQFPSISNAYQIISDHFRDRDDVLVGSEGYLCYDRRNRANWVVPDCVVALGVNPDIPMARNGYEILEVGKPPDFVLEVASETTGMRDYTRKRDIYAAYEVKEYWRFDRSGGEFHDAPLAFDLLIDGAYRRMELETRSDGIMQGVSEVLGIGLRWSNGGLLLYDPMTGDAFSDYGELRQERDAAIARVASSEARRVAAEARAAAAEAELRRLRERQTEQ